MGDRHLNFYEIRGNLPHYVVLFFLYIAVVLVVIVAWFAILFTGRYPTGLFHFVEGVIRWHTASSATR